MAKRKGILSTLKGTGRKTTSDFGALYALGYVVAAFPEGADALRVRKDLLTGGYDARDVLHFEPQVAAHSLRGSLEQSGLLAEIGTSNETLRRQLALAETGCHFLLVHAPSREESDRAMNVVRRVPYRLAQKYHRFAIQDLD